MQDSAEGFGQPIKQIFEPFFRSSAHHPSPFDRAPRVLRRRSRTTSGTGCTCRSSRLAEWLSSLVGMLHHGRIHLYLIYSFVTLLVLLLLILVT